jgi:hypothetical protein
MKTGKTWIALAVLSALGAFWYFYEVKGGVKRQESEAKAKRLLQGFEIKEQAGIDIAQKGQRVSLRKAGGSWMMEAPLSCKADTSKVELLLTQARDADQQDVILEKAATADLPQYGLAPALAEVSFRDLSGRARTLLLGSNSPAGSSVYCMLSGSAKVVLAPVLSRDGMLKDMDSLRDRSVWKLEKIVKIKSTIKDAVFVLQKSAAGEWTVQVKDKPVKAKSDKAQEVLRAFNNLSVKEFVDEAPKSVSKYGLGPNAERLEVYEEASAKPKVLFKGAEDKAKAARYAQVSDQRAVFTLENTPFASLVSLAKDLADLAAFNLKPFEVTKMEVQNQGNTYTAEKKEGSWTRTGMASQNQAPDYTGFLTKLAQSQYKNVVAAPQVPDIPEAVVRIYGEGAKPMEEAVFFEMDKKTGTRLVKSASLNQYSRVSEDLLQALPK